MSSLLAATASVGAFQRGDKVAYAAISPRWNAPTFNTIIYWSKMLTLKHLRTLRHVSILIDHHQGVRRCPVKVTEF